MTHDCRLDLDLEYGTFIHQLEAYIPGDKCGSQDTLTGSYLIPNVHDDAVRYCFSLVERFPTTMVATISHRDPGLGHPSGQLQLRDIRHLVSPNFPGKEFLPFIVSLHTESSREIHLAT